MIRADMHIHTYYSDGRQSPAEAVAAAKRAGLGLMCVTDHDTMCASAEVHALAAEAGIRAVDGIEFSAYAQVKVHILGYGIDKNCPAFVKYYKSAVEGSYARCEDTLKKLECRGIRVSLDEVLKERTVQGTPVHSMFICRAAARLGYAKSAGEFYLSYIAEGKFAHSRVGRLTPEEAVKLTADCGGISSLAHPGRIALDGAVKEELIAGLSSIGLGGIEAVYSGHTDGETAYYKEMARKYSLLVTGGSDTHYQGGSRSVGSPVFYPDEALIDALKTF